MAATFFADWTIERGEDEPFDVDVEIEYTYHAGIPAHYGSLSYPGHPEEPGEIEILRCWRKADANGVGASDFVLADEEAEKIELWLLENPPELDYAEDF